MPAGILCSMDWATIREAFIAARKARGLTQEQVAGIRQGMVSKLETNKNLGPTVAVFVKAVHGIGMSLSAFFAQLEGGSDAKLSPSGQGSPAEASAADETVSTLTIDDASVRHTLRTLGKILGHYTDAEATRQRGSHHRPAPEARGRTSGQAHANRRGAQRHAERRPRLKARRPPKR